MLGSVLADPTAVDPLTQAYRARLAEVLEEAFGSLTRREAYVLRMRFGLGEAGREHTLEEIGRKLNVSRERVRQIEARAIRKLRHPKRADRLKLFVDDSSS